MSWCTAAQITSLLSVARLRPDVDEETRKSADLQFLHACATAVNIGDVLVDIALDAGTSTGLRLNATFAVETLFSQHGWCEGGHFSDRHAVKSGLLQQLVAETFDPQDKVHKGLTRCLALIVSLEFPTAAWQDWLREKAVSFAAEARSGKAALEAVVAESHRCYDLWCFLSNDVVDFFLHTSLTTVSLRTAVTKLFLQLMRKRPRPSDDHVAATPENCVLLSASLRHMVLSALVARMEETGTATDFSAVPRELIEEYTALFAVASRLVADTTSAEVVQRSSFFFLVHLQSVFGVSERQSEREELAEQLLECLLSTLQLFPDAAGVEISGDRLLSCLIVFMIPTVEQDLGDAAQLSAELLEYFMDDEAVPLGCGSGDVAHLAGAVLELYLEHHVAQRPFALAALNEVLRSTPTMNGPLAEAVALALRSVCRVYEASETAVVQSLDGGEQAALLSHISELLLRTDDAHAHIMLIDALTRCFYRADAQMLCSQLVQLLQRLFMNASGGPDGRGVCVQYACLYLAGHLLEELSPFPWSGELLSLEWVQLALQLLSDGDTFGVFSASSALCTMIRVMPLGEGEIQSRRDLWVRGLANLCIHCTVRGVGGLLTMILKQIARVSSSNAASVSLPHSCELLISSCTAVHQYCTTPSPSRHLVFRALVDFLTAHTRALFGDDVTGGCAHCAEDLVDCVVPLLFRMDTELEATLDEPGIRGLAVCLALQCAAFASTRPSLTISAAVVLTRMVQNAVHQSYSSQTISSTCAHLTCVLLAQPAQIEESAGEVLEALFRGGVDLGNGRKGLNYGGTAFFLSLVVLRSPQALLEAAHIHNTGAPHEIPAWIIHLQRGFGWWLSLAPFMDSVQFLYFTGATCRLLESLCASPPQDPTTWGEMPECRQYRLPSPHTKKLPACSLRRASLFQHLIHAWVDLERRYAHTSKPQLFIRALRAPLLNWDVVYDSVTGSSFSSSMAAKILHTAPSDTIAAVLGLIAQMGYDKEILQARRNVTNVRV